MNLNEDQRLGLRSLEAINQRALTLEKQYSFGLIEQICRDAINGPTTLQALAVAFLNTVVKKKKKKKLFQELFICPRFNIPYGHCICQFYSYVLYMHRYK